MDVISQGRINLRFTNRDHHGGLHKAVLNGKESDVEHLLSSGKGKPLTVVIHMLFHTVSTVDY